MSTYLCTDQGTADDKADLMKALGDANAQGGDYKLKRPAGDQVVFWNLSSCLGIVFLMNSGKRVYGHVVMSTKSDPDVKLFTRAYSVIGLMLKLAEGEGGIEKVIFICDKSMGWDLTKLGLATGFRDDRLDLDTGPFMDKRREIGLDVTVDGGWVVAKGHAKHHLSNPIDLSLTGQHTFGSVS